MFKIFKYSFFDLVRSRWTYIYCGFYLLLASVLFLLVPDLSKVIVSLMNIILMIVPLIATMFGVTYSYNSREFTELLLAQPIKRSHIFLGQYLGIAGSLSVSLILGLGIPFLLYGILGSGEIWNYFTLLLSGIILSFIFSAISFFIALKFENKIRGFGVAILVWLFFAVIYDGIILITMALFSDFPLEGFAMGAAVMNPIDLSRILIMLKLDISALMGFTGAVFKKFLGSGMGYMIAAVSLLLWTAIPAWRIRALAIKKDF